VIGSFHAEDTADVGLPLGNLTSQLFVNVYMNEFDHFVKRQLKAQYYIRYADDFIILSRDRAWLLELVPHIANFLQKHLRLTLHPRKTSIETYAAGVDLLGWVHFPHQTTLRTTTKQRMLKNCANKPSDEALTSYLGLLQYGNTHKLRAELTGNRRIY
jgi:hypothetical protein